MPTLDDVAELAAELPEVTEGERFGDETPRDGPILAVRVEDLNEKTARRLAGLRAAAAHCPVREGVT